MVPDSQFITANVWQDADCRDASFIRYADFALALAKASHEQGTHASSPA
jgi:hypothetical protein